MWTYFEEEPGSGPKLSRSREFLIRFDRPSRFFLEQRSFYANGQFNGDGKVIRTLSGRTEEYVSLRNAWIEFKNLAEAFSQNPEQPYFVLSRLLPTLKLDGGFPNISEMGSAVLASEETISGTRCYQLRTNVMGANNYLGGWARIWIDQSTYFVRRVRIDDAAGPGKARRGVTSVDYDCRTSQSKVSDFDWPGWVAATIKAKGKPDREKFDKNAATIIIQPDN